MSAEDARRRGSQPAAPRVTHEGPGAGPVLPTSGAGDSEQAWGDAPDESGASGDDERLRRERPPHWD